MPPRASTNRKKTRLDVQHDEVQRALLARVVAQSSAEQLAAPQLPQQPSVEQQQSSVALLSIHSTSGSTSSTTTGAGLPVRSIRSGNAVAAAAVSGT